MIMNDITNTNTEFNLADFEAKDTAVLEVQNIKDDGPLLRGGQPVRIVVRSPGSREALSAQHKLSTATNARTFAAMRGKPVKQTIDEELAERAERLAAITESIENFPVSPRELYANPKMAWLTNQVEKFHGDWANF
ncbi:hypothetical protein [Massilia sp. TS11]|uniref:hypothetical protein n=1 Tax=Massilia sp. TS11 TaxID=2908003 RepID=UPI001EDB7BCA|nr:hypothetical protein [Massilia sp. TS11]MCG2586489.1 hypothetical protein [Massilia sp. TS11]